MKLYRLGGGTGGSLGGTGGSANVSGSIQAPTALMMALASPQPTESNESNGLIDSTGIETEVPEISIPV